MCISMSYSTNPHFLCVYQLFEPIVQMLTRYPVQHGIESFTSIMSNLIISLRHSISHHLLHDTLALTDTYYAPNRDSIRYDPSGHTVNSTVRTDPVVNISGTQCIYFYNGRGPWNTAKHGELLSTRLRVVLGDKYYEIFEKIVNDRYAEEIQSLSAPCYHVPIGVNSSCYYLDERDWDRESDNESESERESKGYIDVETLIGVMIDKMYNAHILTASGTGSGTVGGTSLSCEQEMLIVMRSPHQLFDKQSSRELGKSPLYRYVNSSREFPPNRVREFERMRESRSRGTNTKGESESKREGDEEKKDTTTTTAVVEEEKEVVKLRGKHEILHGEYSSQSRPKSVPRQHHGIGGTWALEREADHHDRDSEHYDRTFANFVMTAFSYAGTIMSAHTHREKEGSKSVRKLRPIVLVSTNWYGGQNFRLSRVIDGIEVTIEHVNLLSTTPFASDSLSPIEVNLRTHTSRVNELLLSRINASLPKDVDLEILQDTPYDRSMIVSDGLDKVKFVDLVIEKERVRERPSVSVRDRVGESMIESGRIVPLPRQSIKIVKNTYPATLTSHPRCHQLSTDYAYIGVTANGFGVLDAILYELPIGLRYDQFRELTCSEKGRSTLRQVYPSKDSPNDNRHVRYIHGRERYCLFHFDSLLPHTCYGIYFISSATKLAIEQQSIYQANPLQIFMFQTHSDITQSNVSSFLFSALGTEEGGYSSADSLGTKSSLRIKQLAELHDVYRMSNSHVAGIFVQHDPASSLISSTLTKGSFCTLQRFHLLELQMPPLKELWLDNGGDGDRTIEERDSYLYANGASTNSKDGSTPGIERMFQPLSNYNKNAQDAQRLSIAVPQLGSIHISIHGIYGYIMPTRPTNESLREIIKALKLPIWKAKGVRVLVVFTGKTLIHSLFRDRRGYRTSERAGYDTKALVADFIEALLKWKFDDVQMSDTDSKGGPTDSKGGPTDSKGGPTDSKGGPTDGPAGWNTSTTTPGVSNREVKLIGTGHVKKVTTIIISRILREPATVIPTSVSHEGSDIASIAQTQLSSSQLSRVSAAEDLLSMDSSLSRSLADKSKVIPLNPLQLSHLSSIFTKTGIHYTIFPVFYDADPIKAKFGDEKAKVRKSKSVDEDAQSVGSTNSLSNLMKVVVPEDDMDELLLPTGVCQLDMEILYEVLPPSVSKFNGMSFTKARTELYAEAVTKMTNKQPVFYRIDLLMDDMFSVPLPDPEVDYEASVASNSEFFHSVSVNTGTMHGIWMNVQEIVTAIDFFRVVVGPLIGKVTMNDVRIVFEFNMDVPEVVCVLRRSTGVDPGQRTLEYLALDSGMTVGDEEIDMVTGQDGPSSDGSKVIARLYHIKAYTPVTFTFKDLLPDNKYEILIPRLFPYKVMGTFRTTPKYIANTDILFTGGNPFTNVPIIKNLLDESSKSQSINIQNMRILNDFVYNLPSEDLLEYDRMPSMWNLLRDKLNTPGSTASVVMHLAPQTIMSVLWKILQPIYLDIASRIPLDAGEKTFITNLYITQLEHSIKDMLISLLSSPAIAQVFCMCSNVILYHSDYLLPSTPLDSSLDEESSQYRYNLLIRKIFQQQIRQYIIAMYGIDNPDAKEYFHTWRIGSVVMAMIDNVSGRSKLKKDDTVSATPTAVVVRPSSGKPAMATVQEEGGEGEGEGGEGGGENDDGIEEVQKPDPATSAKASTKESLNPAHIFSLGFIDRNQWKSLRSLALDNTVTQLVMVFENPLIPLYGIPETYNCPDSLKRGDVLPWEPTLNDLTTFLKFWIDWILKYRKESKGLEIRSVLIVSQNEVPYTTVIQDIRTGLKIHQVCVGSYSLRDDYNFANQPKRPRSSTIKRKGKSYYVYCQ